MRTLPAVLINGQAADHLPTRDRGVMYGDGVFSTVAVSEGRLQLWSRHLARLQESCRRLAITAPDWAQLGAEAQQLAAGQERAVLRLTLTRGVGGRGYRYEAGQTPTRIVALYPWPDQSALPLDDGLTVRSCATRLACQPALAGLKTLNRLEQILARAEWDDPAIHEGLMHDGEGRLVAGTMSNLFWFSGEHLHTPALTRCGIAGVMRAQILALAADLTIPTRLGDFGSDALRGADEVFISNSLLRIAPVARWDGQNFKVGPRTLRLRLALVDTLGRDE